MTDELAKAIAAEIPRARRRMWILLAVSIAVMAGLLAVGLLMMNSMAASQP